MDPKDPEGYYYLAILYESQERYYKVISNYKDAISCLEENSNYYVSDDNGEKIPNFKIYLKVAETFKIIEEDEDMCEYYQKALNAAEDLQVKEEIEALIKANCQR
jgi:tetratricopeptide (TPR) repeat protein